MIYTAIFIYCLHTQQDDGYTSVTGVAGFVELMVELCMLYWGVKP